MITEFAAIFAVLVVGHAVADYPLQGDFLARFKSPSALLIEGERIWPWALGAHAAIHAGAVYMVVGPLGFSITGAWAYAAAEFVAHAAIDYGKCRGQFGFHADQAGHLLCKAVIAFLAVTA